MKKKFSKWHKRILEMILDDKKEKQIKKRNGTLKSNY